jgi:hypothetical protein
MREGFACLRLADVIKPVADARWLGVTGKAGHAGVFGRDDWLNLRVPHSCTASCRQVSVMAFMAKPVAEL